MEGKGIRYLHYGEGVSSHKTAGREVAVEGYMKTQDADGAALKITTLRLGKQDPVVILECTASDSYKLVNTLNSELSKRGSTNGRGVTSRTSTNGSANVECRDVSLVHCTVGCVPMV